MSHDETAYLMQSPANARRLLDAINRLERHDDDEEGLAGLVTTDRILGVLLGATSVAIGFGIFIYRAFVTPTRPRRTP